MPRSENTEDERVKALTMETVSMHIAQVNSVMTRYGIIRAIKLMNLDETGVSFRENGRGAHRKALGRKGKRLLKAIVGTRNIDHVPVISVV